MYIEAIKFKREESSQWENGYYVGKYENCNDSVILDSNYQPIPKDKDGYRVWDYHVDLDNGIRLIIPEKDN